MARVRQATGVTSGRTILCVIALALLVLTGLVGWAAEAEAAATYEVNALGDAGTSGCDAVECTLREAIGAANGDGQPSTVSFSVAGTITLESALPAITAALTIDGTNAPGAEIGAPTVTLDGTNLPSPVSGLTLSAPATIQGLQFVAFRQWRVISISAAGASSSIRGNLFGDPHRNASLRNRFGIVVSANDVAIGGTDPADRNVFLPSQGSAIRLEGGARARIQGNYIGTSGTPVDPPTFGGAGVDVNAAAGDVLIGGPVPGAGNLLSGSSQAISISSSKNVRIENNLIGTDPDGSAGIPNSTGIIISGAAATVELTGNTIAFNAHKGVTVTNDAKGIDLTRSIIHSNHNMGIDLASPEAGGVTPNDPGDADTGANDLQNFPEIDAAFYDEDGTRITGSLDSNPDRTFRLDFYANPACSSSGYGEGRFRIGGTELAIGPDGPADFDVTLDPLPSGSRYVSALATAPDGSTSEFSPCIEALDADDPAPPDYRVTSLADDGAGSLRRALRAANQSPDQNTITFDLTGLIVPATPLPPITEPVVIDGLSAPGASPGKPTVDIRTQSIHPEPALEVRSPSVVGGLGFQLYKQYTVDNGLGVRVGDGGEGTVLRDNVVGGAADSPNYGFETGIEIGAAEVRLERNRVSGNDEDGVLIDAPGAELVGNRIGLNIAGFGATPNKTGVRLTPNAGGAVLRENGIGGNSADGILAIGASELTFEQNHLGLQASGFAVPNTTGIRLVDTDDVRSSENVIRANRGAGLHLDTTRSFRSLDDRIAGNGGDGVTVVGAATGNDLGRANVHDNGGLGIDLGADGATPNDPGDLDNGPNELQNHPEISSVLYDAHQTEVNGVLDSLPNREYRIGFFAGASCDPSGFGEGEVPIGATTVTTDDDGHAEFSELLGLLPSGKGKISATATATAAGSAGSTSEFGPCLAAAPAPDSYAVNSLDAVGDGVCDSTCTLRDAILTSNRNPEHKTITFERAGTIRPAAALPALQTPATIDGLSAPGAAPGSPSVEITGVDIASGPGLRLSAPASVRGLRLVSFAGGPAIQIDGGGAGSAVTGNRIGAAGDASTENLSGIVTAADRVVIGGADPAERNVIARSRTDHVRIAGGSEVELKGNYIGTTAAGEGPANPSGETGIRIDGPRAGTVIGGPEKGAGNVIAGAAGWGVRLVGAAGIELANNLIGVAADRRRPAANGAGGMLLDDSSGIISTGDTIAFNSGPGIRVDGDSTANDFAEASIHSNSGLGIDLNADGVSANDPGDADDGPNGLQNFPALTQAAAAGAGIRISGEIDVRKPGGLAIDFYASEECDPSGHGEGGRFLGTLSQHFPAAGPAKVTAELSFPDASPRQITATATGDEGTSEFSACLAATGFDPPIVIEPPPRVRAINGRVVVVTPVGGQALITLPNGRSEVIEEEASVPVGSIVNPRRGRVSLTAATAGDRDLQTARFWGGAFKVTQKRGQTLTGIALVGGRRSQVCGGRNRLSSQLLRKSRRVFRKVWGRGKGRFRTKGNRGAAGVRGTHWLTADRCDGTFFRVREGVVAIEDFGKPKRFLLRKNQTYLARAARR